MAPYFCTLQAAGHLLSAEEIAVFVDVGWQSVQTAEGQNPKRRRVLRWLKCDRVPVRNFSHRPEYFQPGRSWNCAESLEKARRRILSRRDRFLPRAQAQGGFMACQAINASPFQCRWIADGSELRVERWTYAICQRCPDRPRVMSEEECGHCACWEPRLDGDRVADAHEARRARRSTFRV